VTRARVLFEGLQERILLSGLAGLPPEVLMKLPRVTETHRVQVTNQPVGAAGAFTLPKFDSHGGTRVLLTVRLRFGSVVEEGLRELDNESGSEGLVFMSIGANVNADSPMEPSFTRTTSPGAETPPPGAFGNPSERVEADSDGAVDWGGDDFLDIDAAGETDQAPDVYHTILTRDLSDFYAVPLDTTIPFNYDSSSYGDLDTDGIVVWTRYNPAVVFGFTATVIYQYPFVGGPEQYWGGKYHIERPEERAFQPFYSGTAEPGSTLSVDLYDSYGDLLGSQSTVVDAAGNWIASFYDVAMTDRPHSLVLRQTYAGYTPFADAGYNLRRYFSPALLGGAYASEYLTVENVLGKRAAFHSVDAVYSATVQPISMGWHMYSFELLPQSATPAGI